MKGTQSVVPRKTRHVVLLGGGHAHAVLLRQLRMRPLQDVAVTLVSDGSYAVYSGMLPGALAGAYPVEAVHIDIRRLAFEAGVAFVDARAVGIDLGKRRLALRDRPSVGFDVLSLNCGAVPDTGRIEGNTERLISVKPIANFLPAWSRVRSHCRGAASVRRVVIIGGGAGGIELALAARTALGSRVSLTLVEGAPQLLSEANPRAQHHAAALLREKDVDVICGEMVAAISPDSVVLASGRTVPAEDVFSVTGARAPAWLERSGLNVD
ncbi:MAG: FAD-dependent oxidoreductase, partial [Bdellovibrionales bacterium]|nr:FAD-dependent oxidoreductase [Bdellovibrionales bacterium]